MLYEFKSGDLLHSRIKTYPQYNITIYDRKVYINNEPNKSGSFNSEVRHTDAGKLSLYELNIDRPSTHLIYPFVTKRASLDAFTTVTTSSYHSENDYGDEITSSYPFTATISRDYYAASAARSKITTLRNSFSNYINLSPQFTFESGSSALNIAEKAVQPVGLIQIPTIFFGSSIKKGSLDLKFYVTGTMVARARDLNQNGELIQTEPVGSTGSGSIAGLVLYNEGYLFMTGSWSILTSAQHTEPYIVGAAATTPKWIYFATTGSTGASENLPETSFSLEFKGVNYINTLTMNCHAQKGELNFSNNPTFLTHGQTASFTSITSSTTYRENKNTTIRNVTQSPHTGVTASFEKTTYISKIGIYDENRNLIAITKLASPVRKREVDGLTIRTKIDLL